MIYKKYKLLKLYLIFILSYLFFRVESFTPEGRIGHSSVLVGNKIYFFGGKNINVCTNEVFYLDVSKPFDSSTPTWIDLTHDAGMPFRSCWGTVSLNDKEQTISLFGGFMYDLTKETENFISNVHSLNLNPLKWNIPDVKGISPKRRRYIKSVIDDIGKMYIFGGYGIGGSTHYNDMIILDTVELSWLISTSINSPRIRSAYTATLLPNGV